MKKILLLKGQSQYDAMRTYIDHWNTILQKKGYQTYLLDIAKLTQTDPLISSIQQLKPDIVLTCNAVAGNVIEKALPEHGRHVTVLYDNPICHHNRLRVLGSKSMIFSCDGFYADFIRRNYPQLGAVGFLPLSGTALQTRCPYEERTIDLLFTGSYFNINQSYEKIKSYPKSVRNIALLLLDRILDDPSFLIWDCMDQIFDELQINMTREAKLNLLASFGEIDLFLRANVRNQVMKAIVDAGFPIHVYGNGWERFPDSQKSNFIWHEGYGNVSLTALSQTKISLNVMPWFRNGIQERNISAMLSGAVSLTDSSKYIEEQFQDGTDIALYSLKETDKIPDQITRLLRDTEQSSKIAQKGYEKARKYHTWENRIDQLLTFLDK